MGKNKILICVLLVVLTAGSWCSFASAKVKKNNSYKQYVRIGDDKYEKTLYQEAVRAYQEALKIKDSKTVCDKLIAACEGYNKENKSYASRNNLIEQLEYCISKYPNESEYWEKEVKTCIQNQDYDSAIRVCKNGEKQKIKSEKFIQLKEEVKHSFEIKNVAYSAYKNEVNGYFILGTGDDWKIISSDMEQEIKQTYKEAGYIGEGSIYLAQIEDEVQFLNLEGVIKGKPKLKGIEFGMYSEGFCSLKVDEEYVVIDKDGKILKDNLSYAGAFQNGFMPVQDKSGKWGLIKQDGSYKVKPQFEEIVVDYAGRYLFEDTIIVKENGKYKFYSENLKKQKSKFECSEIDIPTTDGLLAYKEDEKWGYVDYKGKVQIKAQYEDAKSFSNGVAAVCKNEKWGYINKKGEKLTECEYYECGYVSAKGSAMISDKSENYHCLIFRFPEYLN